MKVSDFQDKRSSLLRDSLRYNWLLVVLFLVLGLIAGAGLSFLKAATYSSSTTVLANQIVGNPYTPDSNSDTLEMLQTEAVAVTSQRVLQEVVDQLGLDATPAKLRGSTNVGVPPNTQALQITYTSTSKGTVAEIVDAIAKEYLIQRQAQAESAISSQVDNLSSQLKTSRAALAEASDTNDPNASAIRAAIIDIQSRISTANAQATVPGRVLTPGTAPKGSELQHILTFAAAGAVLGLLIGLAVALWRERRRDLIRSGSDLDDYDFDAPVTTINRKKLDEESLRHLRMRLSPEIKNHSIVAVVGTAPRQSLSTGALLGDSLAAGGTSVALIDGTGTEAAHRDPFKLDGEPGLAEALTSDAVPALAIRDQFGYLPAGRDAEAASEHLVDDHARTVVYSIAKDYDLTLVACMPLNNVEGEALARLSEGVIVLVKPHSTTHFELGATLSAVRSQGLHLIGVFVLPRR